MSEGEGRDYRYCEPAMASSRSRWHIRPLTEKGPRYGGGADTTALCGTVVAWDLEVRVDEKHFRGCCCECVRLYRKEGP
jgi:hypothetical protein